MNGNAYSYCFLRYRQDPEAGEFANVGVALWCKDAGFLDFQGSHRWGRLKHFFGALDEKGFVRVVRHVENQFQRLAHEMDGRLELGKPPEHVLDWAVQVIPEDDGSLVWGPVRGGVTANPKAELERLYQRYVGWHYEPHENARRDERQVYREVYRNAFEDSAVRGKITTHEVIAPLDSHTFERAWKNGVWNVYETLSFDLIDSQSIERKAHTWFSRSTHLMQAEETPHLHFLLGKPTTQGYAKHYDRAKSILDSSRCVTLVEEDEAEDFARRLAESVQKAA